MKWNYLDLFSGIGGFRYGLELAGFEWGWTGHSEIDKYANRVYARHYPTSEDLGDVRKITVQRRRWEDTPTNGCVSGIGVGNVRGSGNEQQTDDNRKTTSSESQFDSITGISMSCGDGKQLLQECGQSTVDRYGQDDSTLITTIKCSTGTYTFSGRINLITFGFPCQDLSIAGKRGGLQANRSGLFFEAMRIVRDAKPDYFVFENVKGLFSSNGGFDWLNVLREIADSGYDGQWQLLNTRWFLPQNRERIYFIGYRKDMRCKAFFPLELSPYLKDFSYERMYEMPQEICKEYSEFLTGQAAQRWNDELVQRMFKRIRQAIQSETFHSIEREPSEIRQLTEKGISETEAICKKIYSHDNSGRICEVVQLPTEEMLLLWHRGNKTTFRFRFLQSEDTSFDDRSEGFQERIRIGEFGTLLFTVQLYKGRLFYSIGDGRNWSFLCSKEVGRCQQTLSDILEVEVADKYFLSEKAIQNITKTMDSQKISVQPLMQVIGKETPMDLEDRQDS